MIKDDSYLFNEGNWIDSWQSWRDEQDKNGNRTKRALIGLLTLTAYIGFWVWVLK